MPTRQKTLLTILSLLLVIGCSKSVEDSTLINKEGLVYLPDSDEPYSGEVFGSYPTGEKLYNIKYENGRLVGEYTYFKKDGKVQVPIIEDTLVEKDGLKFKDNFPYWGMVIGNYKSGEKVYDGLFINGELSGEYTFYNKDGSIKERIDKESLNFRDGLGYQVNQTEGYTGKTLYSIENGQLEEIYKFGKVEPTLTYFINIDGLKFRGFPITGGSIERITQDSTFKGGDFLIWDRSYNFDSSNNIGVFVSIKSSALLIIEFYNNGRQKEKKSYTNVVFKVSSEPKMDKDGEWIKWYSNGQKKIDGNYIVNEKDGLWLQWYENGQKEKQEYYKNGVKDGLWLQWYENGQKEEEGTYKDGKKDGLHTWWYYNGQKYKEGEYKNGLQHGVWKKWDQNGLEYGGGNFTDGTGKWTEWSFHRYDDSDGKYKKGDKFFTWETNYVSGNLDGMYSEWDHDDGQKEVEGFYKSTTLNSDDGIEVFRVGKWVWYDYNGKKFKEGEYSSKYYYTDKYYYTNQGGMTLSTDIFGQETGRTGVKIGKWIEWYKNKEKKSEYNYDLDGNGDGKFIEWYRNGNKEYEWSYKNGKRDGTFYWWYENGERSRERIYKDDVMFSEKCWNYYNGKEEKCD